MEANFLAWNLFELASYGKFGLSRPDLDGNKLAKGMCFARKVKDKRSVNLVVVPRVVIFWFEFKSASKGLICTYFK